MEVNESATRVLPLVRSIYASLTKSERKVAEALLKDPRQALYASVSDLAEASSVGETTVLRFCRKLGFRSYQEFRLVLSRDLIHPEEHLGGSEIVQNDLAALAHSLTAINAKALQDTLALFDLPALKRAVDILLASRRIHAYGVGSSGVAAQDAKYKFVRMGLPVEAITDPHLQAMSATTLGSEDAVLAFSFSGSTKDTIDSVKLAKAAGARIICITGHARSPLTRLADVVLLNAARETPLQGGNLTGRIAQLHVLDFLYTAAALAARDRSLYFAEQTAKAVLDKLY